MRRFFAALRMTGGGFLLRVALWLLADVDLLAEVQYLHDESGAWYGCVFGSPDYGVFAEDRERGGMGQ